MSFVDLATLTMHRRQELESRIHVFQEKCDRAINDVLVLKLKANNFVSELNCDPSELKERFLNLMKKLDEYMYLITDFNLAMAQTADTSGTEHMPVQDNIAAALPLPSISPYNLMDALTEPSPATSCACPNLCPAQKPIRVKIPKEDQRLIVFSSSSSAESVPKKSSPSADNVPKTKTVAKEVQCTMTDEFATLAIQEPTTGPISPPSPFAHSEREEDSGNLPAQAILEVDQRYTATIMTIDGTFFWVITEDINEVTEFMTEMTEYYTNNKEVLTAAEVMELTSCAYYDEDGDTFYRALFLKQIKGEQNVELFVIDTGEIRVASIGAVQRLAPQFSARPPYARCCHLAGVDFGNYQNKELMRKQKDFMQSYLGTQCSIVVDDNTSESLGVYVILPSKQILNDLMIEQGLAIPIDNPTSVEEKSPKVVIGPPAQSSEDLSNIDVTECPEYEDPVMAVTGYHNRDEADICKHYKGGPEKTCFKGTRCTKKHILKHPDGWTLDKVDVIAKCKSIPLPAPGTWHKVLVTNVCHFDRVFVQIVDETEPKKEVREFGLVLPPATLESLLRDMNSPATIQAYKPLTMTPAPGEMVAAIYPLDESWYRARVLTVTRADQSVEIMYVDYGTVLWVKENQIRALEPRFMVLPTQAIQCVLAGVVAKSLDSHQWALAKRALTGIVHNRLVDAHIIAREYDEVIVELYDDSQCSVAEQLAARGLVNLQEYDVDVDDHVTQKVVVP